GTPPSPRLCQALGTEQNITGTNRCRADEDTVVALDVTAIDTREPWLVMRSEGASGDGDPAEESDDEGERDEHEERHAAHVTDTSERAKGLLRQQMIAAKRHDHGWASNQS